MRAVAILPENDEGLKDIVKKLSNGALIAVVFLATSTNNPPKLAPSTLKELTHKGLVILKSDKVFLTPDGTKIASKYKLESDQQGNRNMSQAETIIKALSEKEYTKKGKMYILKNPLAINPGLLFLGVGRDSNGNPVIRLELVSGKKITTQYVDYLNGGKISIDDLADGSILKDKKTIKGIERLAADKK